MNGIIVYCETDNGRLCDVSLELMTKARDLAGTLSCSVEALLIGYKVSALAPVLYGYGASVVHVADDPRLEFYRTLPYASITIGVFRKEQPQIALFGATSVGRDLAPRVSSALHSGLTADCTSLEIGDHKDKEKEYTNLLYQIRPAFGGNIIATIVNPEHRPQMAFADHARQIGQTGVTVRPKLFISCGISGQIQHTAGMDQSSMIISINSDPDAPIHKIADYAIVGDLNEVIPKIIKSYKQNSK